MCRVSRRIVAVALAVFSHTKLATSTGSGVQCPIVGPTPPTECDGRDRVWFPVSVVGSQTFCTLGPEICVADQFAACPGPSDQLPFGAKCVQFASKVYGCVAKTSCDDSELGATAPTNATTAGACESGCAIDTSIPQLCDRSMGWTSVSVVDAGAFCVQGPVCSADAQDLCPGPQRGLPFGSSCVRIPSGVFGCVQNAECQTNCNAALPGDTHRCDTASDGPSPSTSPTVVAVLPPVATTLAPVASTAAPPTVTAVLPPVATTHTPVASTSAPTPTSAPTVPTLTFASITFQDDDAATVSPDDEDDDGNVSLLAVPIPPDSVGETLNELQPTAPESVEIPMLDPSRRG